VPYTPHKAQAATLNPFFSRPQFLTGTNSFNNSGESSQKLRLHIPFQNEKDGIFAFVEEKKKKTLQQS
jgi:hypothetical protein